MPRRSCEAELSGREVSRGDVKRRDVATALKYDDVVGSHNPLISPNRYESRALTQRHRQGRRRQGTFPAQPGDALLPHRRRRHRRR